MTACRLACLAGCRVSRLWNGVQGNALVVGHSMDGPAACKGDHIHMEPSLRKQSAHSMSGSVIMGANLTSPGLAPGRWS